MKTKQDICDQLATFDVKNYAKTRNFVGGGVSELSPYITHGIITTKECVEIICEHYSIQEAEKFLMELVWKEFFLQVQKLGGNDFLNKTVREDKTEITKKEILPKSLTSGNTKTDRVNNIVHELQDTGLLHNHKRMRLASWCCHQAKLDRKKCADRTYYHFLDGELAPNHLSRQRVNSTFANKPYFMNEQNLQKYREGTIDQDLRGTYEEVSDRLFDENRTSIYWQDLDMHDSLETPRKNMQSWTSDLIGSPSSIYILSPWKLDQDLFLKCGNTIIVLDNNFTALYPRSQKRLDFVQSHAGKYNISFVLGDYKQIIQQYIVAGYTIVLDERRDPVYREAQETYRNHENVSFLPYSWIYNKNGSEPILKFFKYWNKVKKVLKMKSE